jgi:IS5 family transposase
MKKTKRRQGKTLFDEELKLEKLSKQGDPLQKLSNINWEIFRQTLEENTLETDSGKGGRPPYDRVLLFKIIFLQRYYNISDDQIEYQINDRLSFMRFLNLKLADDVPDAKTIWLFKDKLAKAGVIDNLFNIFKNELESANMIANEGSIVDASFVEVPKQRNRKNENDAIKNGKTPEEWEKEENKNKLSQKDTDARWTKKNNVSYYGYKDHVKVENKSKLITNYEVTNASIHDSQVLDKLLDDTDKGKPLYADSAYSGQEKTLEEKEVINNIHEKGYRNKPLTEEQIKNNKKKSKIRVRVEHVFGFIENSMNGSFIRSIGKTRAKFNIGMINLTYNMFRYLFLCQVRFV